MAELHELDAHDQADALRRREISSVDLVEHHLRRIDAANHELGAFITVTADRALARAADADRNLASGDAPPFCGVPTAFKDLQSTAGVRTTMGSALLADQVPTESSYVVDLAETAGFISLGKTNTPEFGLSSYTDNDLVGPARTPWDPARTAGGSSGGAASAVSAGLVPLALGSDGGGSIRIPASCCGVFGFKASRGRISSGPLGTAWSGLATEGALTRTVRDSAALLDVLSGPLPGDSRVFPRPATTFADQASREPGTLRIARWSQPYLDVAEASPAAIAAFEHASAALDWCGHEIVDLPNPWPAELEPQFNVVWSAGIAAAPFPEEADSALRANTRYWRGRGAEASAPDLAAALSFLELTTARVLAGLSGFDAFLTPTLALPPPPVEWFNESGDPVEDHRRELQFTPYTALMNMSGQPAASLPLHVHEGLPIGVMLAAHPGDDGRLLALCAQLERTSGFVRRP